MKFCSKCEIKLERDIENSTDYAICSNCNKSNKEELDKKIINEWDKLFHEYLVGVNGYHSVDRVKSLNDKILFYKSYYLKKILLDKGHSNKIIQDILSINSSVWITAFKDEPVDIKIFQTYREKMTPESVKYGIPGKYGHKTIHKTIKTMGYTKSVLEDGARLKYKIFMSEVNDLKKNMIKNSTSGKIELERLRNKKKHLRFDLTKITRLLNRHKYEIIFVKADNIVAEYRETKKCIFLNLIDNPKSANWGISLHVLGKIIMNLEKPATKKSRENNEFVEEVGAITKYGWHSYNNEKSRRDALKVRLYVEGFKKTIGTHIHIRTRSFGPNSLSHENLPEVDNDILWLQTYPTRHQSSKNKLSSKYKELQKNNKQLKSKKPSSMFFVNMSE